MKTKDEQELRKILEALRNSEIDCMTDKRTEAREQRIEQAESGINKLISTGYRKPCEVGVDEDEVLKIIRPLFDKFIKTTDGFAIMMLKEQADILSDRIMKALCSQKERFLT